jgi:hemerythrin
MRDVLLLAMDRVQDAILEQRGADQIAPLLDDLGRLCAEHFATEERVLRRYGYKHVSARSAMHARLLKKIGNAPKKGAGIARLLHRISEQAGYQESPAA